LWGEPFCSSAPVWDWTKAVENAGLGVYSEKGFRYFSRPCFFPAAGKQGMDLSPRQAFTGPFKQYKRGNCLKGERLKKKQGLCFLIFVKAEWL
jgi:hypothetical protein